MSTAATTSLPDARDVLRLLSRPGDSELEEIVQLAASICGGDAAGITVRRGDCYHVPITYGIEPLVCDADETFCSLTMGVEGLFTVEDAHSDPAFADIGFVNGDLARARFYASAPVNAPDGSMIGRLCVISEHPRKLTDMQMRALETLGHSASKIVELRLLQAAERPAHQPEEQDLATLLKQLSAELNHDLKVPLTGIVASLEMLEDRLDDADHVTRALLQRCASSAGRMSRMLDQHLATATSTEPAAPQLCDLGSVLRMLVDDSATLLESMHATVVVDPLPVVRADADEMYSVFQNLVSNSLKFGRPDLPVRILVTARETDDGWRLAVLDNGVGIPSARRADVFTLFSRAHTEVDGHGIGLATVARIVSALGGRLGAEESPGGGTEIWFNLPFPDAGHVAAATSFPSHRR